MRLFLERELLRDRDEPELEEPDDEDDDEESEASESESDESESELELLDELLLRESLFGPDQPCTTPEQEEDTHDLFSLRSLFLSSSILAASPDVMASLFPVTL